MIVPAPLRLLAGLALAAVVGGVASAAGEPGADDGVILTPDEIAMAGDFSPLPPVPPDPTNAVADDPAAARLGQALFFDARLSGSGEVSCGSCHEYGLGWGDGRPLAQGTTDHVRHSMSLWNVAYNRWFFWDGRKDSLWSQALDPLEDPREHATSRLAVLHVVAGDAQMAAAYEAVFGPLPPLDDDARFPSEGRPVADDPAHPHAVAWEAMDPADQELANEAYANLGKAIAAYVRKLVSRRAPFDVFVEGLSDRDPAKLAALSPAAQRGFRLFAGRGQCFVCHDGPNFTDGEFHNNRVPVDKLDDGGRAVGIQRLKADPFNGASRFADDGGRRARTRLQLAPRGLHYPGEFKTPTLRNVARSAPYMHEGQFATLEDVLAHYSLLADATPLDVDGEAILQPLELSPQETADLVAFLESLSDESLPEDLRGPPEGPLGR